MFTGIVQAVGEVVRMEAGRLALAAPDAWPGDAWAVGESLAVDGCCLTVVSVGPTLEFDVSNETLRRTTLGSTCPGAKVNLERALRAGERLGGHFVQGHVDTVGRLADRDDEGLFWFQVRTSCERYLVDKGSVAVDGVSLTVVQPKGGRFGVALVPHTLAVTTLGGRSPGDRVNVEFDVLAKYALSPR